MQQPGSSFDVSQPAPRVNAGLMARFVGQRVKLVGQVGISADGKLTVKAADGKDVQVVLAGNAPTEQFAEFEGVVESPTVLKEETHVSFGNSFDMANYDELCKLSCGDFSGLFM